MAGKRAAQGAGTIRKKTVTRKGKEYTYWEARITVGRDPGTGKQIQRSFSGKTQKEVREKMQAAAVEVNTGTYIAPAKLTVGQWLDIWAAEYLGDRKPGTVKAYLSNIKLYIKPAFGAVKLTDLHPHAVQAFVNGLTHLSPGSVKLAHKVLHVALEKAVQLAYIPRNPATNCILPKEEPKDIKPLDDEQAALLLAASKGTDMEHIISIALFTGLRMSEIAGLTWDSVDMKKGILTVDKQLVRPSHKIDKVFMSPKGGKTRIITVAPSVIATLKKQQIRQFEMRFKAGVSWSNENNLIFTQEDGRPYYQWKIAKNFQELLSNAGLQGVRFHDLRHTYAVNAIRAGDDIKTIQGNLGHTTAAFTLDKYGHFTERMKLDSANRMESFIKGVLNL